VTQDTTFKVKKSKFNLQGAGAYCGDLPHSLLLLYLLLYILVVNADLGADYFLSQEVPSVLIFSFNFPVLSASASNRRGIKR